MQSVQQKPANGTPLEILVSAVEALHGVQINEDVIAGKCTNAAGYLEKAAVEVERDLSSGITVYWLLHCCRCVDMLYLSSAKLHSCRFLHSSVLKTRLVWSIFLPHTLCIKTRILNFFFFFIQHALSFQFILSTWCLLPFDKPDQLILRELNLAIRKNLHNFIIP